MNFKTINSNKPGLKWSIGEWAKFATRTEWKEAEHSIKTGFIAEVAEGNYEVVVTTFREINIFPTESLFGYSCNTSRQTQDAPSHCTTNCSTINFSVIMCREILNLPKEQKSCFRTFMLPSMTLWLLMKPKWNNYLERTWAWKKRLDPGTNKKKRSQTLRLRIRKRKSHFFHQNLRSQKKFRPFTKVRFVLLSSVVDRRQSLRLL